jgi:hypothetical protein
MVNGLEKNDNTIIKLTLPVSDRIVGFHRVEIVTTIVTTNSIQPAT